MSTSQERCERGARFYQRLQDLEGRGCNQPTTTTYSPDHRELERLVEYVGSLYTNELHTPETVVDAVIRLLSVERECDECVNLADCDTPAQRELDRLVDFIQDHYEAEIGNDSAVAVAIRLLSSTDRLDDYLEAFDAASSKWASVPDEDIKAQYDLFDASLAVVNYLRAGGMAEVAEDRDLEFVENEACQVYEHVTDGKLRGSNYYAATVIDAADLVVAAKVSEAVEYLHQQLDEAYDQVGGAEHEIDRLTEELAELRQAESLRGDVKQAEAELPPYDGWTYVAPVNGVYDDTMRHFYRRGERRGWVCEDTEMLHKQYMAGVRPSGRHIDDDGWEVLSPRYDTLEEAKSAVEGVLEYFR